MYEQEMEGQREAMSRQQKQQRNKSGGASADSLREAREAGVENKVHKYMVELADKRKQAGIISTPSSELLEAERRLAEVYITYGSVLIRTSRLSVLLHLYIQAMAKRKDLDNMKSREYRLTAFTGDLPLGSY